MKEPLVLGAIALFIVALVFRLVRGFYLGRRMRVRRTSLPSCADGELARLLNDAKSKGDVRMALREIGQRVPALDSAGLRAAYRCAGGHLALTELKRPGLAVGFYLRALGEEPTCVEALDKLQEILVAQKRFRRLERTYWDVLGRLDDSEVGDEMWSKCWAGLASVYSASPKTVRRADAIRKTMAAYFGADDVEDTNTISDVTPLTNATKPR